MKNGISVTSAYQVQDVRAGAAQMIDRTIAANRAGLDSLFVGDHHITPTPYYQNIPMMGRLLAEWDSRPVGVLMLLPLWHPVLAAEQMATLASIAEGPFIMQCGLGHGEVAFKALSANIKTRPSAFEQSLNSIQSLWRGDTVSLDGRWQFTDARISPLPPEPIPVWIGASAPPAIERAARMGDAWLADPGLTLANAKSAIEFYRSCLAKQHRRAPETVAIRRDVYVAESARDANTVREMISQTGYRGIDHSALIIGEPGEVADRFSALADLGYTDMIVRNLHRDPQKAVASTLRLASVKAITD